MAKTLSISLFLLLFCTSITGRAFAHGLDCNAATVQFDEPIGHNFVNYDLNSSGVYWDELPNCSESQNVATGNGGAACASSTGSSAVDTALESYDFYAGCQSSIDLKFNAAFSNPGGTAILSLDVMPDRATSWSELARWDTGFPAQQITVPLSSFSTSGFAPLRVRWRFRNTTSPAYIQLDDIRVDCVVAPRADIDISIFGDAGPLPLGAVRTYKFIVSNYSAIAAENLSLTFNTGSADVITKSLSSSLVTPLVVASGFSASLPSYAAGLSRSIDIAVRFPHKVSNIPGGNVRTLIAEGSSQTCDIRLNNNARQFTVSLNPDSSTYQTLLRDRNGADKMMRKLIAARKSRSCLTKRWLSSSSKLLYKTDLFPRFRELYNELGQTFETQVIKTQKTEQALRKRSKQCLKSTTSLERDLKSLIQIWDRLLY